MRWVYIDIKMGMIDIGIYKKREEGRGVKVEKVFIGLGIVVYVCNFSILEG